MRPRSGLALKQGITVLNTPDTIDSDHRGEIKAMLINFSEEDQTINPGDRIAQIIFKQVITVDLELIYEINKTSRGQGGFGHTGKS